MRRSRGAALVDVRLDVVPLSPRSSSLTVSGCLLGGYPVGRDLWGGDLVVGGVLPRISIDTVVWGESSIMTGVYERWCSSGEIQESPSFWYSTAHGTFFLLFSLKW
jgi:hypothetical protein